MMLSYEVCLAGAGCDDGGRAIGKGSLQILWVLPQQYQSSPMP